MLSEVLGYGQFIISGDMKQAFAEFPFVNTVGNVRVIFGDTKSFSISIGKRRFDLQYSKVKDSKGNPSTIFVASYNNAAGDPIRLKELVSQISASLADDIPESLEIAVKYILFVFDKSQFLFGLDLGAEINLSDLPLIGSKFPSDETIAINDFQFLAASEVFDEALVKTIEGLIPDGVAQLPDRVGEGVKLSAILQLGDTTKTLGFPSGTGSTSDSTGSGSKGNDDSPSDRNDKLASVASGSAKDSPGSSSGDAKWFKLQKSFGPVYFEKVGASYHDKVISFLLDASLSVSALKISLDGLSVGSSISDFDPKFHLNGLSISYITDSVEISGAFLAAPGSGLEGDRFIYEGEAIVKAGNLSLVAEGSYANINGHPSLFIFALLDEPLGGPPFFFITGFCGGFGYNSKLRIPRQNEVFEFPFVQAPSQPQVLGTNPTPTEVLGKIVGGKNPWVTPSAGQIWITAGIEFTTYQLINSTALLTVEFGNKFMLALIGLSSARFPMSGDEVYAYVQLQLEAIFNPSEGVISLSAVLSPNSFVLDRACHLTGGFAMCFWFDPSQYAGDFVLTLGGYSPYFKVPAHYPQEPRLGFNWTVDSTVSLSGGVYFALTPSAVMAGGSLNAQYHSGNLKAWFDAHADIIIWYNPFHFKTSIGVSVGASYKVDLLFFSKTLRVELGANLSLWGPSTGGKVHIHWFVISFTVSFGAEQSSGLEKQDWSQFSQILPKKEDVVKINAIAGLAPVLVSSGSSTDDNSTDDNTVNNAANSTWVVRKDNFQFITHSAVPLSELWVEGQSKPLKKGNPLNIKPMTLTGLSSKQTVSIINKETNTNILDDTWEVDSVTNNVPRALWGTGSNRVLSSGKQLIANQLSGFKIKVPPPSLGQGTGDINIEETLKYDLLRPGVSPLQLGIDPQGPIPVASTETIADIEKVMAVSIKEQRDQLFASLTTLGIEGLSNGDLTALAQNAGAVFADEPLLIRD